MGLLDELFGVQAQQPGADMGDERTLLERAKRLNDGIARSPPQQQNWQSAFSDGGGDPAAVEALFASALGSGSSSPAGPQPSASAQPMAVAQAAPAAASPLAPASLPLQPSVAPRPQLAPPVSAAPAPASTPSRTADAAPPVRTTDREPTWGDRIRHAGMALQGRDKVGLHESIRRENTTATVLQKIAGLDPEAARALAVNPDMMRAILPGMMTQKGVPDTVRQYQAYVQDELRRGNASPLSLHQWDLGRRQAGATAVTIADKREKAFESEAGKLQAKRFGEIIEQAQKARTTLGDMRQLADIAGRVNTGPGAALTAAFGPWARTVGISVDGLSDIEAYQAITDRLAPQMRAPGSGATSDFDARQFLSALPGLARTNGGNDIINRTFQAVAQSQIQAGEIASRVYAGEMTPTEGERALRNLPDPYEVYKSFRKTAPQSPPPAAPRGSQAPAQPAPGGVRILGVRPAQR